MGENDGIITNAKRSAMELLKRSFNTLGKLEVQISDQTSPMIVVPLNRITDTTTLTANTTLGTTTIVSVADATGAAAGKFVAITNQAGVRFFTGEVTAVNTLAITLDCPVDFAYQIGDTVAFGDKNLVANGTLASPVIYSLRAADPNLPVTVDITRITIECETTSPVSLAKFGDIPKLINGLCLRRVDGTFQNIVNFKSNGEMAGIAYDWEPFLATNPAQNVDGFVMRLTFAGANKMGVALRIGPGEDLQALIQDALATPGTITVLRIYAQGHVVQD